MTAEKHPKTQYEKDFISQTYRQWAHIKERCQAQWTKDKKRMLRPPIPFTMTVADYRAWAMEQFQHPVGSARCAYCNRIVTVMTFSPDHQRALDRGGESGRQNLAVSCDDCNKIKGRVTAEWFKFFLKCLWEMPDADANDIRSRLLKAEKLASMTRRNTARIHQFEQERVIANGAS